MTPKYLNSQQLNMLSTQYLAEAEKRLLEAYINHKCNEGNKILETTYAEAKKDYEWLEEEIKKWGS